MPPSTFRKLNIDEVKAVLPSTGGIIKIAADQLGVDRRTLKRFIDENPELRDALAEEHEALGDIAESSLIDLLRNGDGPTVRWYLATKHADRGYANKQELTGPKGGPIQTEQVEEIDFDSMTDEQIEAWIAFQEAMKSGEVIHSVN